MSGEIPDRATIFNSDKFKEVVCADNIAKLKLYKKAVKTDTDQQAV